MKKLLSKAGGYDARTAKSTLGLLCWVLAWVGTMVMADKAELYQWYSAAWASMLAIVINGILGLGVIVAYLRFLRQLDELQKKIQLDALALSMGVGLVGSFTYSLLVTANFIVDAEISDLTLLIVLTYVAATIVGQVRYR